MPLYVQWCSMSAHGQGYSSEHVKYSNNFVELVVSLITFGCNNARYMYSTSILAQISTGVILGSCLSAATSWKILAIAAIRWVGQLWIRGINRVDDGAFLESWFLVPPRRGETRSREFRVLPDLRAYTLSMVAANPLSWADEVDGIDEFQGSDTIDADGIRTIVEYKTNEEGKRVTVSGSIYLLTPLNPF